MRKLIVILCLLTASITGSTQPFVIEWQNCFGRNNSHDIAMDVIFTGDGYIMAGYTTWDMLLIKTDLSGNSIWEKEYGSTGIDGPSRIFDAGNGTYFVVGSAGSSGGDVSYDPYPESNNHWILKIDSEGNIIWDHIFGGNCVDKVRGGVPTSDGGVISLGHTCSNDGDISNYFGTWDTWMIKIDTEGNKLWDFTMGTADFDLASTVIETSDHGFLLTSSSTPTTGGNIDCVPHSEYADIVLFKLDSVAHIEWQQCFGSNDVNSIRDMIEVSDGYLLACTTYSGDGDATGAGYHVGYEGMHNQYPTPDIWLVKIDFSGNIRWSKCYGGSQGEGPNRIFKASDGGYIVFGTTKSFDGDVEGNHSSGPGLSDIWVFKINATGELLWQQCFGGNGSHYLESGVVDNGDGSFVIAASISGSNSGQITCQTNVNDREIWLFKIQDTTFVGTNDLKLPASGLSAYPNPANDYVVFELPDAPINNWPQQQIIFITDIYGRAVAEVVVTGEKTVWNTRELQAGVYLYKMNAAKHVASGKIILSNH